MAFKAIWNRQSYVGGKPSPSELLVWAYRWHRRHTTGRNYARLAADCIAAARKDVAAGKTRYLSSLPHGYGSSGKPFAAYGSNHMRFIETPSVAGLRFVGYADKVAGIRHTGWYVQNDDCSETVRGVVFRMAARDGSERFVGGYQDPWNGSADSDGLVCLDFSDIRDNEGDAAYAADSIAERMAESSREYNAAWHAGSRYADLGEEIESSRETIKALLAERRAAKAARLLTYPTICETIRRSVRNALGDIREAQAERRKLREGDYVSEWLPGFYTGNRDLLAAFNEGAGIV
jgi:hypothetical protein